MSALNDFITTGKAVVGLYCSTPNEVIGYSVLSFIAGAAVSIIFFLWLNRHVHH